MRIEWRKCSCDGGYRGPLGVTCSRCEGSGMREVIVGEEGDCRTCQGFGQVAVLNRLVPCPDCDGSRTDEDEATW
mgnify:CR=1 FL=1